MLLVDTELTGTAGKRHSMVGGFGHQLYKQFKNTAPRSELGLELGLGLGLGLGLESRRTLTRSQIECADASAPTFSISNPNPP